MTDRAVYIISSNSNFPINILTNNDLETTDILDQFFETPFEKQKNSISNNDYNNFRLKISYLDDFSKIFHRDNVNDSDGSTLFYRYGDGRQLCLKFLSTSSSAKDDSPKPVENISPLAVNKEAASISTLQPNSPKPIGQGSQIFNNRLLKFLKIFRQIQFKHFTSKYLLAHFKVHTYIEKFPTEKIKNQSYLSTIKTLSSFSPGHNLKNKVKDKDNSDNNYSDKSYEKEVQKHNIDNIRNVYMTEKAIFITENNQNFNLASNNITSFFKSLEVGGLEKLQEDKGSNQRSGRSRLGQLDTDQSKLLEKSGLSTAKNVIFYNQASDFTITNSGGCKQISIPLQTSSNGMETVVLVIEFRHGSNNRKVDFEMFMTQYQRLRFIHQLENSKNSMWDKFRGIIMGNDKSSNQFSTLTSLSYDSQIIKQTIENSKLLNFHESIVCQQAEPKNDNKKKEITIRDLAAIIALPDYVFSPIYKKTPISMLIYFWPVLLKDADLMVGIFHPVFELIQLRISSFQQELADNFQSKNQNQKFLTQKHFLHLCNSNHNLQAIYWLFNLLIYWVEKNKITFLKSSSQFQVSSIFNDQFREITKFFNSFASHFLVNDEIYLSPMKEFLYLKSLFENAAGLWGRIEEVRDSISQSLALNNEDNQIQNQQLSTEDPQKSNNSILHINPKTFCHLFTQEINHLLRQVNIAHCMSTKNGLQDSPAYKIIVSIYDKFIVWASRELYRFDNAEERDQAFHQIMVMIYEFEKLNNFYLLSCCLSALSTVMHVHLLVNLNKRNFMNNLNKYEDKFVSWISTYKLIDILKENKILKDDDGEEIEPDLLTSEIYKDLARRYVAENNNNNEDLKGKDINYLYDPIKLEKSFIPLFMGIDGKIERARVKEVDEDLQNIKNTWFIYKIILPIIKSCENYYEHYNYGAKPGKDMNEYLLINQILNFDTSKFKKYLRLEMNDKVKNLWREEPNDWKERIKSKGDPGIWLRTIHPKEFPKLGEFDELFDDEDMRKILRSRTRTVSEVVGPAIPGKRPILASESGSTTRSGRIPIPPRRTESKRPRQQNLRPLPPKPTIPPRTRQTSTTSIFTKTTSLYTKALPPTPFRPPPFIPPKGPPPKIPRKEPYLPKTTTFNELGFPIRRRVPNPDQPDTENLEIIESDNRELQSSSIEERLLAEQTNESEYQMFGWVYDPDAENENGE